MLRPEHFHLVLTNLNQLVQRVAALVPVADEHGKADAVYDLVVAKVGEVLLLLQDFLHVLLSGLLLLQPR